MNNVEETYAWEDKDMKDKERSLGIALWDKPEKAETFFLKISRACGNYSCFYF